MCISTICIQYGLHSTSHYFYYRGLARLVALSVSQGSTSGIVSNSYSIVVANTTSNCVLTACDDAKRRQYLGINKWMF